MATDALTLGKWYAPRSNGPPGEGARPARPGQLSRPVGSRGASVRDRPSTHNWWTQAHVDEVGLSALLLRIFKTTTFFRSPRRRENRVVRRADTTTGTESTSSWRTAV